MLKDVVLENGSNEWDSLGDKYFKEFTDSMTPTEKSWFDVLTNNGEDKDAVTSILFFNDECPTLIGAMMRYRREKLHDTNNLDIGIDEFRNTFYGDTETFRKILIKMFQQPISLSELKYVIFYGIEYNGLSPDQIYYFHMNHKNLKIQVIVTMKSNY